jgi:cytochrome bd-type quinol oxidase subunit 2
MYNGLLHAHSGLRYVVLALLLAAIASAYSKWQQGDTNDNKLYSFALIATHIQLLIGLVLYVISPKVDFDMMSDRVYRFFTVEHTLMMLVAVVLITVGRVRSRKVEGATRHRTILYFYALALILILVSIPWPFRGLGAGWF